MLTILLPRPLGGAGQVISAWLCSFPIAADRTVTSPAVLCPYCTRGRSRDTGATRSVSTEPCSARFPRYSPVFLAGFTVTVRFSLADRSVRRRERIHRRDRRSRT